MSLWTIDPRDPLVVRDGRPNHGRSESVTLPFPYPGTVAGIVRTRLGTDAQGTFDTSLDRGALRRVRIRGPLLAQATGAHLFAPSPRDAVLFKTPDDRLVLRRLLPLDRPLGAIFDDGLPTAPVGFLPDAALSGKPAGAPAWWPWASFERWLSEPSAMDGVDAAPLLRGAVQRLPLETRTHVKLGDTWTAEEGMLFRTAGLRFQTTARAPRLALAVDVDASAMGAGRALRRGVGPGGGERRLVYWEPAPALSLPGLPAGVRAYLTGAGERVRVRVVLLTPAIFEAGWAPGGGAGQLLAARCGVTPTLVAACTGRPETISGWDFEERGPKPTRRLVSAGSVYWLDLDGAPPDRVRWAEEVMMTNVSDGEQDRRDGFGLAAVGVGS